MSCMLDSPKGADASRKTCLVTPCSRTASNGAGSFSILLLAQLLSPGPGHGPSDGIHILQRMIPTC
eukprot:scaffold324481_cov61-Tisochrysis_lutea.AAC.1